MTMGDDDPRGVANLNPRGMIGRIYVEYHLILLHTKYTSLKANPDYKRLKQVPNLIISLDTEVSTPLKLSNTPQNPITDLIGC